MTQVVARPRDAMRRHAKICQHGDKTLHGISSYCDKSYDVAQNRKKSSLSDNRTTSQRAASHREALRHIVNYRLNLCCKKEFLRCVALQHSSKSFPVATRRKKELGFSASTYVVRHAKI